jgi:hypothetical protein
MPLHNIFAMHLKVLLYITLLWFGLLSLTMVALAMASLFFDSSQLLGPIFGAYMWLIYLSVLVGPLFILFVIVNASSYIWKRLRRNQYGK